MPLVMLPPLSRRAFGVTLAGMCVTLARAAAPTARWALLSDTHIPADASNEYRGFKPVENLRKAVPQVLAMKPEGLLVCGDVARLRGMAEDYAAVRSLLEPVFAQIPSALALGNHDNRKNLLDALADVQKGEQAVKGHHVLVVEAGPVRFIVLDSLIQSDFTPGLLGKAQRTWLGNYLAQSDETPTLLFVHHTLDDNDGALLDAPRLFDIVKGVRKVKAILYGHSHEYKYDVWEGIHLVNLPALGYNFRDSEPVGWVEAEFTRAAGRFTLHALGGNVEKDGKTTEVQWRS
jgi:Icc protein